MINLILLLKKRFKVLQIPNVLVHLYRIRLMTIINQWLSDKWSLVTKQKWATYGRHNHTIGWYFCCKCVIVLNNVST